MPRRRSAKTPAGVAKLAKLHNKPVICVSGGIDAEVRGMYDSGIDVVVGATQAPMTLAQAIAQAPANIRHAVSSVLRAMLIPQHYGSGIRGEAARASGEL
ncbi:hypothetical protein HMSSN036_11150 [Paenibacillus macerans]|nr:hypothetical protein HMSSN036_11150 [Paenibacillus macerans]